VEARHARGRLHIAGAQWSASSNWTDLQVADVNGYGKLHFIGKSTVPSVSIQSAKLASFDVIGNVLDPYGLKRRR
jgi:hypothetical protein